MAAAQNVPAATSLVPYGDLNALRSSGRHCDLKIEVHGGHTLNAHRGVLATRLPLLGEHIEKHSVRDGGHLRLLWKRFSRRIVDLVLDFVYMGEVKLGEDTVERILLFAFLLDCCDLQRLCVDFMALRMTDQKKRSIHLEIARATKSKVIYTVLWRSLSIQDFESVHLNLDEIVSFVKASTWKSDELFRLICVWGDGHKEDFKTNRELLAAFTRLIGLIDVADLSKEATDEFELGFSYFRLNMECGKHFLAVRNMKKRLLVFGQAKGGDGKTACLLTLPQFEPDRQLYVRFPYLWYRGVSSLNGKVYCIGGKSCSNDNVFPTVTVVDGRTGRVTQAPPLLTPRRWAAVAASTNELFVCCGHGGRRVGVLSSCERWVEGSPSWRQLPHPKRARSYAAAIVLSEDDTILPNAPHLLLTGGCGLSDASLLSLGAEGDARWIDLAPMHHSRYRHGIALFAGRVLVVAGYGLNSVEMLTPPRAVGDPGQWTDLNPIGATSPLLRVCLAVYQNRLLAFECLDQHESQIEELIADPTGQKINDEVDLTRFTWRRIAGCPDALDSFGGAVVVDIRKEPPNNRA